MIQLWSNINVFTHLWKFQGMVVHHSKSDRCTAEEKHKNTCWCRKIRAELQEWKIDICIKWKKWFKFPTWIHLIFQIYRSQVAYGFISRLDASTECACDIPTCPWFHLLTWCFDCICLWSPPTWYIGCLCPSVKPRSYSHFCNRFN